MNKYIVLWSLRGRAVVEAETEDEAEERFYQQVEALRPAAYVKDLLSDNDGYEVDDVVPA